MATIRLSDITITRGDLPGGGPLRKLAKYAPGRGRRFAIHNLTLTIPHGKTVVILGPSGCGKSTLLRVIAGLEAPDGGRVLFNGRDVAGISPGERKIGYLFQSYALYPHFDVKRNITSYFFFRRKTPEMTRLREEKFKRTSELLDVAMAYLLDRMPANLSGGEKQRVALGRCITREPELFLLDEPFSNLDAKLRHTYRQHLKTLLREFSITTVYVTHDQQEAVLLADLIAVMRLESSESRSVGSVEQIGTVRELYDHPGNTFVADFLNLHGDVPAISFIEGGAIAPELDGYTIGVRPEDVAVGNGAPGAGLRAIVGEIKEDPLRQYRIVAFKIGPHTITAKMLPNTACAPGEPVELRFRNYHVFDRRSGEVTSRTDAIRKALG